MKYSVLSIVALAALVAVPAGAQTADDPAAAPEPIVLRDTQATIVNQSTEMIMRLEFAPVFAPQEGTDGAEAAPDPRASAGGELLRGAVISAGNYGLLTVPGGATVCTFVVSVGLQSGTTVQLNADLCLNPVIAVMATNAAGDTGDGSGPMDQSGLLEGADTVLSN